MSLYCKTATTQCQGLFICLFATMSKQLSEAVWGQVVLLGVGKTLRQQKTAATSQEDKADRIYFHKPDDFLS